MDVGISGRKYSTNVDGIVDGCSDNGMASEQRGEMHHKTSNLDTYILGEKQYVDF